MMHIEVAHVLWSELHDNAKHRVTPCAQRVFMIRWLEEAEASIGCASCWRKVVRFCDLWPVAYGEELWLWSISLHDYVNKELGRPLFYPDLTLAPLLAKGIIH